MTDKISTGQRLKDFHSSTSLNTWILYLDFDQVGIELMFIHYHHAVFLFAFGYAL